MKVRFKPLFFRQLKKVTEKSLKEDVATAIYAVETVTFVTFMHRKDVYKFFP